MNISIKKNIYIYNLSVNGEALNRQVDAVAPSPRMTVWLWNHAVGGLYTADIPLSASPNHHALPYPVTLLASADVLDTCFAHLHTEYGVLTASMYLPNHLA